MTKEYSHIVSLDDDDDDKNTSELEIDLESDADPTPAEDPEPSALKADPEPQGEPEDEPSAPDPRDRELALLKQQLAGVTQYLNENERQRLVSGRQSEVDRIDRGIKDARAKLKQATESGDADAIIEATEALTDLKVARKVVELSDEPAPARQQPQQPTYESPAPAREWMQRNSTWFDRPGYEAESLLARAIDQSLVQEGWSPNSPAYYRELNKRISAKTKLRPEDIGGPRRQVTPAPATAAPRASSPVKKGSVRLTAEDFAIMRMTGLDRNNKEHLREYARNKIKEGN